MKTPKLLKIVKRFLSADKTEQYKKIKCFKEILKKLKKKEIILKNKLEQEQDNNKQGQLEKNLAIIYAQRCKGVDAIKELKKND